jgi:hypothetical protein
VRLIGDRTFWAQHGRPCPLRESTAVSHQHFGQPCACVGGMTNGVMIDLECRCPCHGRGGNVMTDFGEDLERAFAEKAEWEMARDRIDEMLGAGNQWKWAEGTLTSIREWVVEKRHVTPAMIEAINNIEERGDASDDA